MIHPFAVNALQQNYTLQLTKLLRFRELSFFCFVKLHSLFLQFMLDLISSLALYTLRCQRFERNDRADSSVEFIQIPLFRIYIIREAHIHIAVYCILDHIVNSIPHVLTIQHLTTLFVNDLTLFIINLVIIQKIFTNTKVIKLNLLLCFLNSIGKHLMLNLLILCNTQRSKDLHQSLRTKQTHQVILQRDVETGFTRVSLSTGTSTELIVNTSGFMTLCTDDHQATGISCHIIQLNIRTTASHVSGNGNCPCLTCLCYDLCLQFMEFGIQYIMLDSLSFQHAAE